MLKTTVYLTPVILDFEFEGHAVGLVKRNLRHKTRIKGLPYFKEIKQESLANANVKRATAVHV